MTVVYENLIGREVGNWKVIELDPVKRDYRHYWICVCKNCGVKLPRSRQSILTKPCCMYCNGLPRGESGLNCLYGRYRGNYKKVRRRDFYLTLDEFRALTSSPCHYCGRLPHLKCISNGSPVKKQYAAGWGTYTYNSIDRLDNTIGYTFENCVPCCKVCNRAKSSMTYRQFVDYLQNLCKNFNSGKLLWASTK